MWFDQHGRTHLPWQQDKSPYRVWVAEIMLQQTQVSAVIPYYERFMARFDSIASLAAADQDTVLHHWSGLGYYARARNLHKAAQIICVDHAGQFPNTIQEVNQLPGIGRSTAGAILACSMNQRHPILDGNVKRVLTRYHAIEGYPSIKTIENQLWGLAEQHTPQSRVADYTQAIMDLGATLCTRSKPQCERCPMKDDCKALQQNKVSTLPTPKPKQKKRRLEKTTMLCLVKNNKLCALTQRNQKGIWGGLWCPIEFANKEVLCTWCQNHSIELTDMRDLGEEINHSFTHFDLQITPLYLKISELPPSMINATTWFNFSKPAENKLGLAAPVNKLMERLQHTL